MLFRDAGADSKKTYILGTLVSSSISTIDATAVTKGVVQLAGDLGGTAALPTVPSARKWYPVPTGADDAAGLISLITAGYRDIALRSLTYNFTQPVVLTGGSAPISIQGQGVGAYRFHFYKYQ